jgi:hypothetical protein
MAVFGKPTCDHPLDHRRVIAVREPVVYVWNGRIAVTATTHLVYDFGLTFMPPVIPRADSADEIPDDRDRLRMFLLEEFSGARRPRNWYAPGGITMKPLMLLLAIYPGWLSIVCARRLVRAWMAGNRKKAGKCTVCGYSLTGNTTGRCSECGASFDLTSLGSRLEPNGTEE